MAKNGKTTLKITGIPEEVLTHNLLPLLQPNDVVRLRRVCKQLKSVADDHLRLHVRNKRILHIGRRYNGKEKYDRDGNKRRDQPTSMKNLLSLKCHLPVSKLSLYFDNGQESIFEDGEWQMHEFLEKYGEQITHLTMSTISTRMINQKEIDFYEGLSSLTHLTIIDVQPEEEIWGNEDEQQDEYYFPRTFRNLRYLDVQSVNICQRNDLLTLKKYLWTLVEFCANLETLVYPHFAFRIYIENRNLVSFSFNHLITLLGNGKLQKFTAYHLTNLSEDELSPMGGPTAFAEFCHLCNTHNVKLHVKDELFDGLNDATLLERVGRSIVSLKCEDISNLKAILPNLEYLDLCLYEDKGTNWDGITVPVRPWPKLKRLIFNYSEFGSSDNNDAGPDTVDKIHHILFKAMQRPSVKSLELFCGDHPLPPAILKNVAWSCFNLRTVKIVDWSGRNEEFSVFWRNLPLLEEVCLSACQALGDSGFIGENVEEPVFLGLKNLRKLSLHHMHEMTMITDVLFKLVIRHLQLREFYITSCGRDWGDLDSDNLLEIHSITKEGIKSLLTSDFAQSIERFPFDSWMLSDMSSEEFLQIGNQFRSSQML